MLIVYSENRNELYGFSKYEDNLFFSILTNKLSRFDLLVSLKNNDAIYPEDFPNKRAYLNHLKDNKQNIQNEIYQWRISQETINILKREISDYFLLFIGNMEDFFKMRSNKNEYINLDFEFISDRDIFYDGKIYLCSI